jgi:transcriptional regulator with XRE-family HTH domain
VAFLVTAAAQLGPTLRGLRRSRALTQAELAQKSGLRQKTISLLETAPHRCSVDSLLRYLGALGTALSLQEAPTTTSLDARKEAW